MPGNNLWVISAQKKRYCVHPRHRDWSIFKAARRANTYSGLNLREMSKAVLHCRAKPMSAAICASKVCVSSGSKVLHWHSGVSLPHSGGFVRLAPFPKPVRGAALLQLTPSLAVPAIIPIAISRPQVNLLTTLSLNCLKNPYTRLIPEPQNVPCARFLSQIQAKSDLLQRFEER